jgi:hypothetical protein
VADEKLEPAQRGQRLGSGLGRELAGLFEPDAEPGEQFFVEDRCGYALRTGIDDQPDRVRPDVDDRCRL